MAIKPFLKLYTRLLVYCSCISSSFSRYWINESRMISSFDLVVCRLCSFIASIKTGLLIVCRNETNEGRSVSDSGVGDLMVISVNVVYFFGFEFRFNVLR